MAAGGLSPHPLSIAGYESAAVDWIIDGLHDCRWRELRRAVPCRCAGAARRSSQDEEFRAYIGVVAVATVVLAVGLVPRRHRLPADAWRQSAFQVASIITTTGFASHDFQLWSDQAKMVLFLLMFIGGCAGSAGGGPKVVRHLLLARLTLRELRRTLHPRAVLPVKLGGRVVPENILRDIQVFMLFYLLIFSVCATIVVALGADLLTGITASIACLGNIGPGFNHVGPMANFGDLHPVEPGELDAGDVDWPPRGPHRPGGPAAGGVAIGPVVGRTAARRARPHRRRAHLTVLTAHGMFPLTLPCCPQRLSVTWEVRRQSDWRSAWSISNSCGTALPRHLNHGGRLNRMRILCEQRRLWCLPWRWCPSSGYLTWRLPVS